MLKKEPAWQKIRFTNSRGLPLAGLLCRPSGITERIVIICHGFTGSKEGGGRALALGEELARRGRAVLVFDFSGNGESGGEFSDLTLSGQIDDLSRAVDWAQAQGFRQVVTMGRSFGGSTVICQGARDKRVAGVCTWAAPARLIKLFHGFAPELPEDPAKPVPLSSGDGIVYLHREFFRDLSLYDVPGDAARLSPRPLLVTQGLKDAVVPPSDAQLIYNAAGEPRELVWIKDGDHQFTGCYRPAGDALFHWLEKYFGRR
ncbi:alpha/beta hydrolase [Desulfotomaculum copahuensis]|uniref:Hydrolase n=1 Tax=Desulfotomaculum copahuensis TaxID=1838280 RepID=A0A1B7LCH6_9FIRM|nr:alpha/beta hydrolase [Desulfotomaculum copahuensis]OAT80423.1 hydrolase [Desulfotomaculum copahuensis]